MHVPTAVLCQQARVWRSGQNFCSAYGPMAMMASSRSNPTLPSLPSTGDSVDLTCFVAPPGLCSKCYRQWVRSMHRRYHMRFGVCAPYREVAAWETYPFDYLEENVQRFLLPERPQEDFDEVWQQACRLPIPIEAANSLLPADLTVVATPTRPVDTNR